MEYNAIDMLCPGATFASDWVKLSDDGLHFRLETRKGKGNVTMFVPFDGNSSVLCRPCGIFHIFGSCETAEGWIYDHLAEAHPETDVEKLVLKKDGNPAVYMIVGKETE